MIYNIFFVCIFIMLLCDKSYAAINDPISDYLTNREIASSRINDLYYNGDDVYVLHLDLNSNGITQTLISSSLDRDGKQGLVWTVYNPNNGLYVKNNSTIEFNLDNFFLGAIDTMNQYGIVSFSPSGSGEGSVIAHVYDGNGFKEIPLGQIRYNKATGKYDNDNLFNRYFGTNSIGGGNFVTVISSDQLSKLYGIKVDPRTYEQALVDWMKNHSNSVTDPNSTPSQSITTDQSSVLVKNHPISTKPKPISTPVVYENPSFSVLWSWLIGGALLTLVIAMSIIFRK